MQEIDFFVKLSKIKKNDHEKRLKSRKSQKIRFENGRISVPDDSLLDHFLPDSNLGDFIKNCYLN